MLSDWNVYCYKLLVRPKTYFNIYSFQFSGLWEHSAKPQPDLTSLSVISFEIVPLCSFSLASVTFAPICAYWCCEWVSSIIISELYLQIQQERTTWLEKCLHRGFKCLCISYFFLMVLYGLFYFSISCHTTICLSVKFSLHRLIQSA